MITAYFDQINKSGGINGPQARTDRSRRKKRLRDQKTLANTKVLIRDKRFALLEYSSAEPPKTMNNLRPGQNPRSGRSRELETAASPVRQPQQPVYVQLRASYADETESIVNRSPPWG